MANIKISELNELTNIATDDLLPIVDTSVNETKKVQLKNVLNVELIAISDTAPAECLAGDKYYNTEDNKIYTAIATDTWGTIGETPVKGVFYIVFNEQSSYSYDGSTLISVGGGTEDIVISDTEPTEEGVKLWIDTGEIAQQVSEITNEYSTSTGLGYSANYINTNLLNVLGDRKGTYTYSLEGHVSGGGRFVNVYIPFINLNYNTDTYTISVTAIYQNGAIKTATGTVNSLTKYLDGMMLSYNTTDTLSNLYNCSINITLEVS